MDFSYIFQKGKKTRRKKNHAESHLDGKTSITLTDLLSANSSRGSIKYMIH